jgi:hypothetical protein
MGSFFSSPYDQEQCDSYSNDEIAFRTKQYVSILKIISILQNVIDKKIQSVSNPEAYLVDSGSLLVDIDSTDENNFTYMFFKPELRVTSIENGEAVQAPYTVLHEYNDFILHQFNLLSEADRYNIATQLFNKLVKITQGLIELLNNQCSIAGYRPVNELL